MLKICSILLLNMASLSVTANAASPDQRITVTLGKRIAVESKVLNETRELLIHLPADYDSSKKRYPVLYLLDGERHFNHAILASQLLYEVGRVPELIIVGIPNKDELRERDLALEKEKFTLFIKDETLPYIDAKFQTNGVNALYGHSLAGLFTISMLAEYPTLFDHYIAASPPLQRHEEKIYNKLLAEFSNKTLPRKSLYFSLASEIEEGKQVYDAMNRFVQLLQQKTPKQLRWRYQELEDETHITSYYVSLFKGLAEVCKESNDS